MPAAAAPQTDHKPPRPIRSYVRREGRITPAQQRALDELLPRYAATAADADMANTPAAAPIDPHRIFANNNPVIMEIGFGNGESLMALAAAHPQYNFIGVETHRPGVGRLLNALHDNDIDNVRVITQDAAAALDRLPHRCLRGLWLFFPDPWPKKKHHKRRIVNARFTQTAADRLDPGGVMHIATDWRDYALHIQETVAAAGRFRPLDDDEIRRYPFRRPATKFERRGRGLGHKITDLCYRVLA